MRARASKARASYDCGVAEAGRTSSGLGWGLFAERLSVKPLPKRTRAPAPSAQRPTVAELQTPARGAHPPILRVSPRHDMTK
jgi:hypothetical protein